MSEQLLKRPLLFACSAAVFVCYLCSFLDFIGMITLCAVLMLAFLFLIPFKSKLIYPALLICIACFIMVGVNAFNYFTRYRVASKYADTEAIVTGEVSSVDDGWIFVDCKSVEVDGIKEQVMFTAAFGYKEYEQLMPSAKVRLKVVFFDDVYRTEKQEVSIYGQASEVTIDQKYSPMNLDYMVYVSRSSVEEAMPFENEETSAFIKAIILGNKDDVSGVFLNKFNTVGLSHFMSLSGLHLVFAVAIVDFVLSLLGVGYRPRAAVALVSVLLFTFISGFSVSCVRSAIMMSVYYIGRVIGRVPDGLTSLSISCFLILLVSPYNIYSLSFLLSSSATFGIIFLYPCILKLFSFECKIYYVNIIVRGVVRVFSLSLSATLMCMPILAVAFKQVCVISPLISVVISFPLTMLFYVGAVGTVFCFVPYIGSIFSVVADLLYSAVEFIVEKCYNIENITLSIGYKLFYFVLILLAVLVIGVYVFYKTKKSRRVAFVYISGYAVLCIVLFVFNSFNARGKVNVHFVDVGQGNCTAITYRERATLIDCGGEYKREITDVLVKDSIKHIDLIALSHVDKDHICFVNDIINKYTVDEIAVPYFSDLSEISDTIECAREAGIKITVLDKDTTAKLYNGSVLHCYVENSDKVHYIKNLSAVYKFEMGDKSALFTGDISIFQEYYFLERADDFDVDVFLAAHHGSKSSTHKKFVELCSPEYSVISVGKNNSYGHPSKAVVDRLEQVSDVLMTSELSTISFQFTSKGYKYLNEY